MKKVILFCVIALFSFSFALAETLTVGCATKCDTFFRLALRRVGRLNDVNIRVVDVSQNGAEIAWDNYDAIILPGGADIDPKYYLSAVEPELQEYTRSLDHLVNYSAEGRRRDPIEFNLLKKYFSNPQLKDLPVLGVCRGMQMLAVSQGIPLYVDIKTELGIRNRRYLWDRINMNEEEGDSLMSSIFPHSFRAFKRHHQGVRVDYFKEHSDRWSHLSLTAFSNSGKIAEALEFKDRPVLGVQFHPENDFGFERKRIFNWLISKALERKKLIERVSQK
ncbi:MAG: gamma-glutamyl-gamma-aminobutyrate hydrolase family protein [Bacteriovoracaceae bacterium]